MGHPERLQPGDADLRCVFVNWVVPEEDFWTAVWQHGNEHRSIDGPRDRVTKWALAQPADRYWIFSAEANDWVPLDRG